MMVAVTWLSIELNDSSTVDYFNLTIAKTDYNYLAFEQMDNVFKFISLFLHVVYLLLLVISSHTRRRQLLFVNHAIIVSFVYSLILLAFVFRDKPNFDSAHLNELICTISEIVWSLSYFARMYSILLIAVYRYIATYKLSLFKRINKSRINLAVWIVLMWVVSIGLSLTAKFAFSTTYGETMCLDGQSTYLVNSLLNFLFKLVLSVIIPGTLILVLNGLILKKLKSFGVTSGLAQINTQLALVSNNYNSSSNRVHIGDLISRERRFHMRSEARFSHQFTILGICVIVNSCVFSFFQLRSLLPNYNTTKLNHVRIVSRMLNSAALCFLPAFSLYFHPFRDRLVKFLKSIFLKSN